MKSEREFTGTLLGFDDFVSESVRVFFSIGDDHDLVPCTALQIWC